MSNAGLCFPWQYCAHWARERSGAEALVHGERVITWQDLWAMVEAQALRLVESGALPGDRVAVCCTPRPEAVSSMLAAGMVGAIWMGISPRHTLDEVRAVTVHASPTVLIVQPELSGIDLLTPALEVQSGLPSLRSVLSLGPNGMGLPDFTAPHEGDASALSMELREREAAAAADDEALLLYTSGSSGRPKGVLHSHRAMLESARAEAKALDWGPDTRALLQSAIDHVAASVEIIMTSLVAGGTLIIADRFEAESSLRLIESQRVSMVGQLPVMYMMQMDTDYFSRMDWSPVKHFVWGGYPAPKAMFDAIAEIARTTGARLSTGYGTTETCGFVTYTLPDEPPDRVFRSVGKEAECARLRIVDDQGNPLGAGEVGEITVQGPTVMKGYLFDPSSTYAVLDEEGWYHTGDLGYLDVGGYLYITGRKSDMFKSGGESVHPGEVEDVLDRHSAVLCSAVVSVPDPLWQEVGVAYVMPRPGAKVTPEDLRAYCRERLISFKVPKRFELRDELPLLGSGKVDRQALRAIELG